LAPGLYSTTFAESRDDVAVESVYTKCIFPHDTSKNSEASITKFGRHADPEAPGGFRSKGHRHNFDGLTSEA